MLKAERMALLSQLCFPKINYFLANFSNSVFTGKSTSFTYALTIDYFRCNQTLTIVQPGRIFANRRIDEGAE